MAPLRALISNVADPATIGAGAGASVFILSLNADLHQRPESILTHKESAITQMENAVGSTGKCLVAAANPTCRATRETKSSEHLLGLAKDHSHPAFTAGGAPAVIDTHAFTSVKGCRKIVSTSSRH